MYKKGFTLVEILLVVSTAIIIAAFTIPVGIKFFQMQTLNEAVSDIVGILRRAQSQSVFQKSDSAFGIKFLSGSYVLFQGDSYGLRDQGKDEVFTLLNSIVVNGIDEVVFTKLTGIPNITGTLTIVLGDYSQSININAQGKTERQ